MDNDVLLDPELIHDRHAELDPYSAIYESGQNRRRGNPVVLVKRPDTDIPVIIYFLRSLALLMYFYDGPFHAFF